MRVSLPLRNRERSTEQEGLGMNVVRRPRSIASLLVSALCLFGAWNAHSRCQAGLVIGSFDLARGGHGSIADSPELDIELLRGVIRLLVDDVAFTSSAELTESFLNTVDVLVLASNYTSSSAVTPLSPAEQAAMFNYVVGGGDLILAMENIELSGTADITHESFLDPFGMSITGVVPGITTANLLEPDHPIFHGEAGVFSTFELSRTGWFDELGPYARSLAESVVNQQPVMALIDRNVIAPGSGRVLITADTQIWERDINLTGNMVLYFAAVPEPDSLALGTLGGVLALGFVALRRRDALAR